jgi:hypothetical protein
MHVETVTHTACAAGDFVITGSKVLLPPSLDRTAPTECNTRAGRDCEILEEAAARNRVHQEVFRAHGVR